MADQLSNGVKITQFIHLKTVDTTRTTLKLPSAALVSKEAVASYWEADYKDVIDSVIALAVDASKDEISEVRKVAVKISSDQGVRQTYVLSGWALKRLDELSSRFDLHRDAVLGGLLVYADKQIKQLLEEQRQRHLKALSSVRRLVRCAQGVKEEVRSLLKPDDSLASRINHIAEIIDAAETAILNEIEKGEPIDGNAVNY
jgi:hypothetical protein